MIEVELHEDKDGHITLIGYRSQQEGADQRPGSQRSSPKFQRESSPDTSQSEMETSAGSVMNSKCLQAECTAQDMYR